MSVRPSRQSAQYALGAVAVSLCGLVFAGCDFFEKNTLVGQLLADDEFEFTVLTNVDALEEDASGDYVALAPLPVAIAPETGASSSTRALITAGGGRRAFVYDGFDNAWTEVAELAANRSGALALSYGSQVVVVSGIVPGANTPATTIDIFDLAAPDLSAATWTSVPLPLFAAAIPTERSEAAAAIVGDHLFLLGGRNPQGTPTRDVTIFDLRTATTSPPTHHPNVLPEARVLAAAFVAPVPTGQPNAGSPRIHLVGGHDGDGVGKSTDFVIEPDLAFPFVEATLTTPQGRIDPQIVVGEAEVLMLWSRRFDFGRQDQTALYDLQGGAWVQGAQYPRLLRMPSGGFSDGHFRVFGGLSSDESKDSANELEAALPTAWVAIRSTRERHGSLVLTVGDRLTLFGGVRIRKKDREVGPF